VGATRERLRSRDFKSLLATRRGTLVIAIACAVIAAGILAVAMVRYRDSVSSSNAQSTVLVANALIQKGTSGTALAAGGMYTSTKTLGKDLSPGAISDAAALQGKVTARDILPGQQLTLSDFSRAAGIADQLARNERAISIPLDSSHGLGGLIQAGDRVDVYAGFNVQGQGGTAGPRVRLLIPDVLVLQTAASAAGGLGSSGGNGNVVLAVNDNQAAEMAYASDNGKVWLVLRPGNAKNPTQISASLSSILFGRPPIALGRGRP
jgi:Flp pilus assembly protein CpaB